MTGCAAAVPVGALLRLAALPGCVGLLLAICCCCAWLCLTVPCCWLAGSCRCACLAVPGCFLPVP
eukprot:10915262-Karenia_brevis.AAC.1